MEHGWIEQVINGYKRVRVKLYTLLIRRCFRKCGRRVSIAPPLRFANLSLIELGDGVTIHDSCWIHVLEMDRDDAARIIVRDNVSIGMGATISAAKRIEIGANVFTARNVYISDHGHEFRNASVPTAAQGISQVAPVTVGADTWIGQNAVILPGVSIGRHCVIGANAVVNVDIPDFCVAAGVPARVVKRYNPTAKAWERVS